jgi:hypothetical protein
MGSLFFPQLSSGAVAQFPFSKKKSIRTIQNMLADGTMLLNPDPNATRITWDLNFNALSSADIDAIQAHFTACLGPYRAFTFIDPSDNMFLFSSDLLNSAWTTSPNIQLTAGIADPLGGSGAFTVTNNGQIPETIGQTILVPCNYQYCFSVYVRSSTNSSLILSRSGSTNSASNSSSCGPNWSRVVSAGRLSDSGTSLTAAIELLPGQSVQVFGPQLEPQIEPSGYCSTASVSGVYTYAHWVANQFWMSADAPGSFATTLSIECVL